MSQALDDITILDFSHLLQGPFATMLLADMGAHVIKVERPGSGEMFRQLTFNNRWLGGSESPNFVAWNRNKKSIAIDLKSPEARALIHEIIPQVDVVVQNFRPGVLDRLGYGYEALSALHPGLIYCSGSGYGDSGPYVDRPGQDLLIQGLTGLAAATGRGDGPPVPVGAGFADQVGAMNMVYGILTALHWRGRTGMGQEVKVNLLAGLLAHQAQELMSVLNFNENFERPRSGIGHPGMDAPFGIYETASGYLTIAMSPFATLLKVLEAPELAAFDDPKRLFEERDVVHRLLSEHTRRWQRADLLEALLKAGIWCGEIKTHLEVEQDPQVQHMQMITSYEHPAIGRVKAVAPAVELSKTPASIRTPSPGVGQHTAEVLRSLGIAEGVIASLIASKVIEQEAPAHRAAEAG